MISVFQSRLMMRMGQRALCSVGLAYWLGLHARTEVEHEHPNETQEPSAEASPAKALAPASSGEPHAKGALPSAEGPSQLGTAQPGESSENSGEMRTAALAASDNLLPRKATEEETDQQEFQARLEEALKLRRERKYPEAENAFLQLLYSAAPPTIQRKSLLEMGVLAQEQRQYTRAQQIFSQYLNKYREDPSIPEVLLLQGLVYRDMGAHNLAVSRFFAVMSTALNLPQKRTDYYERLVLRAQTEIAETYYLKGDLAEASEYLSKLLKLNAPQLNRGQIRSKLIRTLAQQGRPADVVTHAYLFLSDHPLSRELPEMRFLLASALKKLGRNREATEQVLALLQPPKGGPDISSESWLQWRQRAGNEVGNQLYEEGDYFNALEIYLKLSTVGSSISWQIPVLYQIGLVYERMEQPPKATEAYSKIAALAKKLEPAGITPALSAVIDMAKWRSEHLAWQSKAVHESSLLRAAPPQKISATSP